MHRLRLVVFLAVIFGACDTAEPEVECTAPDASFSGPTASVRFVFINVFSNVDAWVQGQCAVAEAVPNEPTSYVPLPAGQTRVTSTTTYPSAGVESTVNLVAGQKYTIVVMYGQRTVVLDDTPPPVGKAGFRGLVGQGGFVSNNFQVEIEQPAGSPTVVASHAVAFGTVSPVVLVNPGGYVVRLRSQNSGGGGVSYAQEVSAVAGHIYTQISTAGGSTFLISAPPSGAASE